MRKSIILVVVVSVVGTAIATTFALLGVTSNPTTEHVGRLFSLTAAALFLGAGVLRLARWRLVRDARSLLMGAALVVLGGISIPLTSLADLLLQGDDTSHLRAATAIVTTLVAIVLTVRALTLPEERQLHPTPVLLGSSAVAVGLFALVLATHLIAPGLLRSSVVEPPLMRGTVLALAWFALAYVAALTSSNKPWAANLAPLLGCMSVSELLRINQVFLPGGWALACVVLIAVVAVFTVHRALVDLDEATKSEHAQLKVMSAALSETQAGVDAHQAWREELTHDARNALAGLRAALHTLERYDGQLDQAVLERLRAAAIGELGHLEHLIVRAAQDHPVDFDVMHTIRDAVETRRAAGLDVEMHQFSCTAHGRPGDLVTVVQNLLVNAHLHGHGKEVRLCVVESQGRVELYVSDRGPGLTDEQVERLFERGARGERSVGTGLGLFVSRTLMREQGGDLELRAHHGGAVFVVTLPAARPAQPLIPRQRITVAQPLASLP